MKPIINVRQMFTIIHDGYSYAEESFNTLKEAKKRQAELLGYKYADPCRIIKETIVRQELAGTYKHPIKLTNKTAS